MGRIIYILFIALAVASSGCSSKKSGSGGGAGANYTDNTNNGNVPPVTNPITNPEAGGASTSLVITSQSALNSYVGWSTNNPTDAKIGINLAKIATYAKTGGGYNYSFGGLVSIQFTDGNSNYTDEFTSTTFGDGACGQYDDCNTVSGNVKNNKYNLLSTDYPGMNGKPAFHGFFEDTRVPRLVPPAPGFPLFGGAVVLVIDSMNDLGDGAGPTSANGSVWFKNYLGNYPMGPLPLTHCWFISSGPYDCRAWKNGDNVNTMKALNPDSGYTKLGTFTNLPVKEAFSDGI